MAGLYIHIPFCRQACHYCDFHFSTQLANMPLMMEAMEMEIRLRLGDKRPALETIYFGGGTPSLLPDALLTRLFRFLEKSFEIEANAEITLEANPDDGDKKKIGQWKSLGINRLSVGIQTLDNDRLRWMNRLHDATMAIRIVKTAQDMGMDNLSLDLMYQFPDSKSVHLQNDLEQFIALEPRHISAYGLTIEEKTVLGHRLKKGQMAPLPDEKAAKQFEIVIASLAAAGYEQYEISNFAQAGFHSRHNSNYWFQVPFWGIGPGAHGFIEGERYANKPSNPLYIKNLLENKTFFETRETLSSADLANEMILTRLRTKWGLPLQEVKDKTGFHLEDIHQKKWQEWEQLGLFHRTENQVIILTQKGKLLADHLALQLMVEED